MESFVISRTTDNFEFSCTFFELGYLVYCLIKTFEILYICTSYIYGTVSPIFYLGSNLIFMKSRKNIIVNLPKVTRFLL